MEMAIKAVEHGWIIEIECIDIDEELEFDEFDNLVNTVYESIGIFNTFEEAVAYAEFIS